MKQLQFGEWIPENLEEAKKKFEEMYRDSLNGSMIVECMTGILYCRIKKGEEFVKAYEHTLKTYIEISNRKKS